MAAVAPIGWFIWVSTIGWVLTMGGWLWWWAGRWWDCLALDFWAACLALVWYNTIFAWASLAILRSLATFFYSAVLADPNSACKFHQEFLRKLDEQKYIYKCFCLYWAGNRTFSSTLASHMVMWSFATLTRLLIFSLADCMCAFKTEIMSWSMMCCWNKNK